MNKSISIYYFGVADGELKHWKFGLDEDTDETILFDIIGYRGDWTPRAAREAPHKSPRYIGKTPLCNINESSRTQRKIILTINNINAGLNFKDASYDCQDYVLQILDELVSMGIIDVENEDYLQGMEDIKDNYGK